MDVRSISDYYSFCRGSTVRDIEQLLQCCSHQGRKQVILFIQPHIFTSLSTLIELPGIMNSHHFVKGCFPLDIWNIPQLTADVVLYWFNPTATYVEIVVEHLHSFRQLVPSVTPQLVCIPEKTVMTEQILEEDYGLRDKIPGLEITNLDLDILYIDHPVLSMEIPNSFKGVVCDGDISVIRWISRLLLKIQTTLLGPIPTVVSIGPTAARVATALESMQPQASNLSLNNDRPVDKLFLVDRSVDLVTPLLTQTTYEGLLEELYGFDGCQCTFPFPIDDAENHYFCGLTDKLFNEFRDKCLSRIGSLLYEISVDIKQRYEQRKELDKLKEVREFMENLAELQETHRLVGVHACIAKNVGKLSQNPMFRKRVQMEKYILHQTNNEAVLEYMEQLIHRKSDLNGVLRLLCLYSVVRGGLKSREYDLFKEKMMLSYGVCETVSAFIALSKPLLLSRSKGKPSDYSQWQRVGMGPRGEESEQSKEDWSQLYEDYAPPIVRLMESHLASRCGTGTSRSVSSVLEALSSTVVHVPMPLGDITASVARKTTVLFLIGGLTRTEANCFRLLQKKYPEAPFIVCCTNMTCGNHLINAVVNVEES